LTFIYSGLSILWIGLAIGAIVGLQHYRFDAILFDLSSAAFAFVQALNAKVTLRDHGLQTANRFILWKQIDSFNLDDDYDTFDLQSRLVSAQHSYITLKERPQHSLSIPIRSKATVLRLAMDDRDVATQVLMRHISANRPRKDRSLEPHHANYHEP